MCVLPCRCSGNSGGHTSRGCCTLQGGSQGANCSRAVRLRGRSACASTHASRCAPSQAELCTRDQASAGDASVQAWFGPCFQGLGSFMCAAALLHAGEEVAAKPADRDAAQRKAEREAEAAKRCVLVAFLQLLGGWAAASLRFSAAQRSVPGSDTALIARRPGLNAVVTCAWASCS